MNVGPWLVWGMRAWRKRVPPRLLNALIAERCAAWCREHDRERAPAAVSRDIRTAARTELLRATPPEVADVSVLLDVQRNRLILPGLSEAASRGIVRRLLPVLRRVVHPDVRLLAWDLESYLVESRPASVTPSEVGDRWLAFLTGRAASGAWAVFRSVEEHDEPVVFKLELDGRITLATNDNDAIHVDGKESGADVIRWVGDEQGRVRVREVNLLLTEPEPSTRRYAVRLDNTGAIRACKIVGGDTWAAGEPREVLQAATFERAETMNEVALYVRLLMHAFDAGPLEKLMTTARQVQFWPGSVAPRVEWYDELPSVARLGVRAPELGAPDERARRRNRALGVVEAPPAEAAPSAPAVPTDFETEILELWRRGQHAEAITRWKKHAGCTRGEAKEAVELLVTSNGLPLHTAAPARSAKRAKLVCMNPSDPKCACAACVQAQAADPSNKPPEVKIKAKTPKTPEART